MRIYATLQQTFNDHQTFTLGSNNLIKYDIMSLCSILLRARTYANNLY